VDRGERVRRRHRHDQSPPRSGIDAAGHLLRLASHPPHWILGAAAGAGAAVPAVALNAAWGLVPASRIRTGTKRAQKARWLGYAVLGGAAAATIGPYLVIVLVACGVTEIVVRRQGRPWSPQSARAFIPAVVLHGAAVGGFGALAWVAFKVGALFYGGGFVIIPLMQHDAVTTYHWMSSAQFLNAVALGQVTPGPVVQTVAVVGYAAGGVGGGLLAALIAFAPRSRSSWAAGRASTRSGPTPRWNPSSLGQVQRSSAPSPDQPSLLASRSATSGRSRCSPVRSSGSSCSEGTW
jgi:chromate transport protein ChrA